ncbi:MAG: class E sortase [Egicoccus sp.]
MTRIVRGVGWTLVISGAVVLLYVVYLMWFTDLSTDAAQRDLAESWQRQIEGAEPPADAAEGVADPEQGDDPDDLENSEASDDEASAVDAGEGYAALWFERDGEPVVEDVLYVVEGVAVSDLKLGPGHYPDSATPGSDGNLAIAGHRTTYGRPFWALDELRDGDTIHVVDRDGTEWVYAYREQRVVAPSDVWVVEDDPLDTGEPTITLTTCHPLFSAAQRLIVWGELVDDPSAA